MIDKTQTNAEKQVINSEKGQIIGEKP